MNDKLNEAARFREAMSRVAASVTAVTTDGTAGRHGATATSVASLTDEPPTLIVCLNADSRIHKLAVQNGVLAVNVLSAGHEALARAFAASSRGKPDNRFSHGDWDQMATGAPTLQGALATFDGRIVKETPIGTHVALFLEVEAIRHAEPQPAGLIYHRRGYRTLPAAD